MSNQDWSNLGDEIKNIVESAVDSRNFKQLNESISKTINSAMESVNQGIGQINEKVQKAGNYSRQDFVKERPQNPWENKRGRSQIVNSRGSHLFAGTSGMMGSGLALSIIGGIFSGGIGLAVLLVLLVGLFTGGLEAGHLIALTVLLPLLAGSGFMAWKGGTILGRMKRFKLYMRQLGSRTYCSVKELADYVGKPESFVLKDVRDMIHKNLFRQGHVDKQGTCLIVSDETFEQYRSTQMQLEQRQMEERKIDMPGTPENGQMPDEVKRVIEEGNTYLRKIRECNDAIPGEEISANISRLELIIHKIFMRLEQHPEQIAYLRKFMDYYLPTTVKLLDAYRELDEQPVQGVNITSSKREIEETLDTINKAFENLLDGFFQDTAWDISSDISVLQTMLAQEGLTGKDFKQVNE